MANPFNFTQKRYDKIIQEIIRELDVLFNRLVKTKEEHKELRETIVHKFHADQQQEIKNKREILKDREASHNFTLDQKEKIDEIDKLRIKFGELIEQDIDIERKRVEQIKINQDPERINIEINIINELRREVQNKAGDKGKRRKLTRDNTAEMYDNLLKVHKSILIRKEESELTKQQFKPLQDDIKRRSDEIISLIDQLIDSLPEYGPEGRPDTPGMAKAKGIFKDIKEASDLLEKQKGWVIRAFKIVADLRKVAELDGTNASQLQKKAKRARTLLGRIKRSERWEQWRASVSKLKKKLKPILDDKLVPIDNKKKIEKILVELKIWESDWLVNTVKSLDPLISKKDNEIDWDAVINEIDKILKDTKAMVADDEALKKVLEEIEKQKRDQEVAKNKKQQKKNLNQVQGVERRNLQMAKEKREADIKRENERLEVIKAENDEAVRAADFAREEEKSGPRRKRELNKQYKFKRDVKTERKPRDYDVQYGEEELGDYGLPGGKKPKRGRIGKIR